MYNWGNANHQEETSVIEPQKDPIRHQMTLKQPWCN